MTPVVVSVNDEFSVHQCSSYFRIAAHVLAEPMGDLNDSANVVMTAPFYARDGKTIRTGELESLWLWLRHTF